MHGDTAEKIRSTAHQLMVERGYAAFSYADISQTIGITKASIHHHFPTKAGLAAAVLTVHRERLALALGMLDDEIRDPLMRLTAYLQYWERCIRDGSMTFCVAALLGAEMPTLPEEVQAEIRQHFAMLFGWMERTLDAGKATGVLRLEEPAATEAQMMVAVVHGAMLSARASQVDDLFHVATSGALRRITRPAN